MAGRPCKYETASGGYTGKHVRPTPAAIAEAKRAHEIGHQSTVATLMGDPLPGRSALDRRSQAQ